MPIADCEVLIAKWGPSGATVFQGFSSSRGRLSHAWEPGRSEMGRGKKRLQRAERFAAMADGGLGVASFGQRLAVGRVEEDRVVAEAALPFGLRRDASFDRAAGFEQHAIAAHERERADESRRAFRLPFLAQRHVNACEL